MKLKAGIALALVTLITAPATASDSGLFSKVIWAADVGTHLYDAPNMESFNPSLEIGIKASAPVAHVEAGTVTLEAGISQSAVYGTSELTTQQIISGYSLSTAQMDLRRLFVQLGFETRGKFFLKPQIGFEHISSKLRLYDPGTGTGFNISDSDSNAFASLGMGYRFSNNQKGVLSLATLGDDEDNRDYRITYSAFLGK